MACGLAARNRCWRRGLTLCNGSTRLDAPDKNFRAQVDSGDPSLRSGTLSTRFQCSAAGLPAAFAISSSSVDVKPQNGPPRGLVVEIV